MRRFGIILFAMAAVLLVALLAGAEPGGLPGAQPRELANPGSAPLQQIGALTQKYSLQELQQGVYVGSRFCLACHPSMATWDETLHARFLRRPLTQYSLIPRRGVIADYDNNGVDDFIQGLDFNTINSAFDPYKPNAPVLSVVSGVYYVTIGGLQCPVTFTQAGQGGGSAQRYAVKIPVTDTANGLSVSNYFAPLQFVPGTGWVPNSPQNWYDGSNNPIWGPGTSSGMLAAHGGNYSTTCVGCHSTGIRELGPTAAGEPAFEGFIAVLYDQGDETLFDYDGDGEFELMNIGCESCHGAGSAHILGGGDPERIVNPAELPVQAQVDICGRCHSQPHSVPNGTYNWPYDDANGIDYTPVLAAEGVPWSDYATDASVRWPDGIHGKITRPYHDYLESPKPTFQFRMVSCTDCHDPHAEVQAHQIRGTIVEDGITIPTAVENNTLCLACHATHGPFADITPEMVADYEENLRDIRDVVEAHTHHPYGPERSMGLSRCVECHMPAMTGRGTLSGPSHVFDAVGPAKTLEFQDQGGMPNSCSVSCHSYKVDVFGIGIDPNPNNSVWDEPFDRTLARRLLRYFGPGGVWWDTEE